MVSEIFEVGGKGHSVGIASFDDDHIHRLASMAPVSRIMVRQPNVRGNAGSFTNGMPQTASLGCGTWGGNITSENISVKHYMNTTWVSRPIPEDKPSEQELLGEFYNSETFDSLNWPSSPEAEHHLHGFAFAAAPRKPASASPSGSRWVIELFGPDLPGLNQLDGVGEMAPDARDDADPRQVLAHHLQHVDLGRAHDAEADERARRRRRCRAPSESRSTCRRLRSTVRIRCRRSTASA